VQLCSSQGWRHPHLKCRWDKPSTLVLFSLITAGKRSDLVHLYSPFPTLPVTAHRPIWGPHLSWSAVRSGLENEEERITEASQICGCCYGSARLRDSWQKAEVARGHNSSLASLPSRPSAVHPVHTLCAVGVLRRH